MNGFKIQHLVLCSQGILYQQYVNSLENLKNESRKEDNTILSQTLLKAAEHRYEEDASDIYVFVRIDVAKDRNPGNGFCV